MLNAPAVHEELERLASGMRHQLLWALLLLNCAQRAVRGDSAAHAAAPFSPFSLRVCSSNFSDLDLSCCGGSDDAACAQRSWESSYSAGVWRAIAADLERTHLLNFAYHHFDGPDGFAALLADFGLHNTTAAAPVPPQCDIAAVAVAQTPQRHGRGAPFTIPFTHAPLSVMVADLSWRAALHAAVSYPGHLGAWGQAALFAALPALCVALLLYLCVACVVTQAVRPYPGMQGNLAALFRYQLLLFAIIVLLAWLVLQLIFTVTFLPACMNTMRVSGLDALADLRDSPGGGVRTMCTVPSYVADVDDVDVQDYDADSGGDYDSGDSLDESGDGGVRGAAAAASGGPQTRGRRRRGMLQGLALGGVVDLGHLHATAPDGWDYDALLARLVHPLEALVAGAPAQPTCRAIAADALTLHSLAARYQRSVTHGAHGHARSAAQRAWWWGRHAPVRLRVLEDQWTPLLGNASMAFMVREELLEGVVAKRVDGVIGALNPSVLDPQRCQAPARHDSLFQTARKDSEHVAFPFLRSRTPLAFCVLMGWIAVAAAVGGLAMWRHRRRPPPRQPTLLAVEAGDHPSSPVGNA